ncbi:cupin domain-containing protein [Burkholderia pseudomultivorans]|uniref:cupin domain-containing protein n=1 Tax=Burkholderia pseudomultivorans TaxID=1207504 RepID=UPI002875C763|nr:cupin domain-containing protein [Burkholderia pseudomultivorans]MDS0859511.1 cupin domain-containing protein [Burkholderia pseudomultivorans]
MSSYETLLAQMTGLHTAPLWELYMKIASREPRCTDRPMHWHWDALSGVIETAAREVSLETAERRVVLFANPAFAPKIVTTTNLQAGFQILEPGESARPHRHSASALRFIMSGKGGATLVNGQRCAMAPGDLITNPAWCWHEHVNDTDERIVWFDGLDVPFVQYLDGFFFEEALDGFATPQDASALPDASLVAGGFVPEPTGTAVPFSPLYRYAGDHMSAALSAMPIGPDGTKRMRYVNPLNGGAIMPTLDCYMLELTRHAQTRASRGTSSAVCLVVEGEGRSTIGDTTIEWRQHDVFTIPHWHWVTHLAVSATPPRLFMMTDRELLSRLHLLIEQNE